MESFNYLIAGFEQALQPAYIGYSFAGAFLGTVVGVLPGIGPAGALAMLLPLIVTLDPLGSVIMLAAVYTGSMYGGSTTSILLRIPGDTSAVITCLDGHEMARQGRAGSALCIAAIGSFIAGTIAVVGLMILGPVVANAAIAFSAPEYFALYAFGLAAVASFAGNSLVKALLAMMFGLMISTVGEDVMGVARFTYGYEEMFDGIQFLAVTLGLFAISEVLINAKKLRGNSLGKVLSYRIYISLKEIKESMGAIGRGGVIGFLIGLLPGAGASIAAFISYSIERQVSRTPEKFGHGEIRGVASPEAANNASSAGAFVPMLSLGIPGSSTTAIMLGAFILIGIDPGPLLFVERPDVVWTLIASLYLGNVILLILNLPLIGIFVQLLHMPMAILLPSIIVLSVAGIYVSDSLVISLVFMCVFGIVGYYMRKYEFPMAPVILGVVVGGAMEQAFRQSMTMLRGNPILLMERPIVVLLIVLACVFMFAPMIVRRHRVVLEEA